MRAREPGTDVQIWFILNRIITTAPSFYGGRVLVFQIVLNSKKKERRRKICRNAIGQWVSMRSHRFV